MLAKMEKVQKGQKLSARQSLTINRNFQKQDTCVIAQAFSPCKL